MVHYTVYNSFELFPSSKLENYNSGFCIRLKVEKKGTGQETYLLRSLMEVASYVDHVFCTSKQKEYPASETSQFSNFTIQAMDSPKQQFYIFRYTGSS
jgi:hypothetical protein